MSTYSLHFCGDKLELMFLKRMIFKRLQLNEIFYTPPNSNPRWLPSYLILTFLLYLLFILYFPGAPYRIFLLYLPWLPCYFFLSSNNNSCDHSHLYLTIFLDLFNEFHHTDFYVPSGF